MGIYAVTVFNKYHGFGEAFKQNGVVRTVILYCVCQILDMCCDRVYSGYNTAFGSPDNSQALSSKRYVKMV